LKCYDVLVMNSDIFKDLLVQKAVIDCEGILVAKEIAEKTIWDKLAVENPTHAVISAKNEAEAQKKSEAQIAEIKTHLKPDDVLLDCGTGYGRVAKYILPVKTLAGYIGVDSSYEMLALFKKRYESSLVEQRTPVLFLNADIHSLPLKSQSVSVVLVSAVFLHNHKNIVQEAMREITRVLKPGGKLLVYSSFPRAGSLMGLQGLTYQMLLNLLGRPYKNGPVRYYFKREVRRLLADFAEVEYQTVGFAVLPKTIIGLPGPLEKVWRIGLANPLNSLLERLTPTCLKPYFAVHFDIVAKR
jgi:ubiquinone/menaquinone biosynthesis C-methylase UbiE